MPLIRISISVAGALDAKRGDLVHVSDRRAWLGGLRSTHAIIDDVTPEVVAGSIELGPKAWEAVIAPGREDQPIRLERLY